MIKHHHIVAIGASAGGVEALSAFFDHTLVDGVSYVIIPHLSVDFKSRMTEILSMHSKLEILEATEGIRVEVNKIYLIPNTKFMGIKKGRLFLIEKAGHKPPHMTIDTFFISLAEERGNKAIGVILSGVGSDGTKGGNAIQKAGGIVLVQEPTDAKFDGMPNAAIASDHIDYILPVGDMPMAIEQYVQEDQAEDDPEEMPAALSDKFLSSVVNLIKGQFPFDFTDYKVPTLQRRIKRRMVHHNLNDEDGYYSFLKKNPQEFEMLINDFLIGVTSFFRNEEAFEILENDVIPQLARQKAKDEVLKIWVAGCATGEEAYSIAILIKEHLLKTGKNTEVKIFATDINRIALDRASKGVFTDKIAQSVSAERLENFFDKTEEGYRIKQVIRKMLIFAHHDLTKNPPYCNIDLISCRNMLIYMKPILQKQVLAKLHFGLRKDGVLFLGSSENISVAKDEFLEISAKWKIFQSIKSGQTFRQTGYLNAAINSIQPDLEKLPVFKGPAPTSALLTDMTDVVLAETGFCGVLIDEQSKVVQSFGDLSPFLKPERFNFNLKELLFEPLSIAFSAAVHKVLKENRRVRIDNIILNEAGVAEGRHTDLVISPFRDGKTKRTGMLVLFNQRGAGELTHDEGEAFNMDSHVKQHIINLEDELLQVRQDLQSSNEFLESSKESLQSFNEELLSANEEMQSANEELQSMNEELETINIEHQYTIQRLTELNDDLNNYFRSSINGQLFVDGDLNLKKYSPGIVKLINVKERDIGRPLSNITTNIKVETLIENIRTVMSSGETITKEVESKQGRIYEVMTIPYLRHSDMVTDGAIVTFYDITKLKTIQHKLDHAKKMLLMTGEAASIGTWSMDMKTREFTSSARFKAILGFLPGDTVTFELMIAQIIPEHQPLFLKAVDATLNKGERFDVEFSFLRSNDQNLRWFKAIGNLTIDKMGRPGYFTGILHDITEKKKDDIRKNDFIAMASHELKTPLTSVQAYLQMLTAKARAAQDDFTANALGKANKQVKKMGDLINNFLNVSRLEAGKIQLDKRNFNLDELINDIMDDMRFVITDHNLVALPCSQIAIFADRDKIGQVINNFLTNAVKYSEKGKNIEVSCKELDGRVQVSVKDEGIGMALTDRTNLFDRYYRIENTQNRTVSGFGIGLYLSSEIIQRHDGKIWVDSEPGKGSTFHFSLPIA